MANAFLLVAFATAVWILGDKCELCITSSLKTASLKPPHWLWCASEMSDCHTVTYIVLHKPFFLWLNHHNFFLCYIILQEVEPWVKALSTMLALFGLLYRRSNPLHSAGMWWKSVFVCLPCHLAVCADLTSSCFFVVQFLVVYSHTSICHFNSPSAFLSCLFCLCLSVTDFVFFFACLLVCLSVSLLFFWSLNSVHFVTA